MESMPGHNGADVEFSTSMSEHLQTSLNILPERTEEVQIILQFDKIVLVATNINKKFCQNESLAGSLVNKGFYMKFRLNPLKWFDKKQFLGRPMCAVG